MNKSIFDDFSGDTMNVIPITRGKQPKVVEEAYEEIIMIEDLYDKGEFPEKFPSGIERYDYTSYHAPANAADLSPEEYFTSKEFRRTRDYFTTHYTFCNISMNWIRLLKEKVIKDGRVMEIMAGSGLLSAALKKTGVNVVKTIDNNNWAKDKESTIYYRPWLDLPSHKLIEEMDCVEAIEKYGKDVDFIVVSWPYMDDTCYRSLLKMREVNRRCIMIYIGEFGDCCADDNFVDAAILCEDIPDVCDNIYDICTDLNGLYQCWCGIHDGIYFVR